MVVAKLDFDTAAFEPVVMLACTAFPVEDPLCVTLFVAALAAAKTAWDWLVILAALSGDATIGSS